MRPFACEKASARAWRHVLCVTLTVLVCHPLAAPDVSCYQLFFIFARPHHTSPNDPAFSSNASKNTNIDLCVASRRTARRASGTRRALLLASSHKLTVDRYATGRAKSQQRSKRNNNSKSRTTSKGNRARHNQQGTSAQQHQQQQQQQQQKEASQ